MSEPTDLRPPPPAGLGPVAATLPRVLVLGGAGFIGRHVVQALRALGTQVIVGSRHPERVPGRLPADVRDCPARRVRFETLLEPAAWTPALVDADVVVNCVGILRPRGRETYERVHHAAPAALAAACRLRGIRLIHVSALGLDDACRSGFLRSKRRGEAALKASGVSGWIVRPSLLDAPSGGYGALWIRRAARWPLLPLPADASGRIAALDVRDLGEALATLAGATPAEGLQKLEFGGLDPEPLRDYLARLRRGFGLPPAVVLPLPGWLARTGAHVCDLLHVTPYSFGHWELLRRDNCPAVNHLPALLGRPPRRPGEAMPAPPRATPRPVADIA